MSGSSSEQGNDESEGEAMKAAIKEWAWGTGSEQTSQQGEGRE